MQKSLAQRIHDILATRQTDFPEAGDDLKVSLRNSKYDLFPVEEAQDIKDNYLSIWREGGNIRGNRQFELLAPIARRGGNVETLAEENAVRRREAWAARHFEDYSLAEAKDKLQERVSPRPDQSKDEFLSFCMGSATMIGEYPAEDQRYAVCNSYWENKDARLFENPCWDGYVAYGLKPNGDPRCIPEKTVEKIEKLLYKDC